MWYVLLVVKHALTDGTPDKDDTEIDSDEVENNGEEESQSEEDDKEEGDESTVANTVEEKVVEDSVQVDVKKRKYKLVNLKRKEKVKKLRDADPKYNERTAGLVKKVAREAIWQIAPSKSKKFQVLLFVTRDAVDKCLRLMHLMEESAFEKDIQGDAGFFKRYAEVAFQTVQNERNNQIRRIREMWLCGKNPEFQLVYYISLHFFNISLNFITFSLHFFRFMLYF